MLVRGQPGASHIMIYCFTHRVSFSPPAMCWVCRWEQMCSRFGELASRRAIQKLLSPTKPS